MTDVDYRYREILTRLYSSDTLLGSGVHNGEAYLVTTDRLVIYGQDGWVMEFQLDEISYDVVELKNHKFLEIVDLLDPTAQNYFYYGLYEIREKVIGLLRQAGVS